jgi:exopolysaccharide biosynthesis polyprenyl glycosylphosphotransferase
MSTLQETPPAPARSALPAVAVEPPPTGSVAPGRRREALQRRLLAVADSVAALTSLLVVAHAFGSPAMAMLVPLVIVGAKLLGLYDRDELRLSSSTLDEFGRIVQLAAVLALLIRFASPDTSHLTLGRGSTVALWLTMTVLLTLGRTVVRGVLARVLPPERCLFVGDDDAAERFAEKLRLSAARATVTARLPYGEAKRLTALDPTCDRLDDVRGLLVELQVDRVVIAPAERDTAEVNDLIRTLEALDVRISVVPRAIEVMGSSVVLDELEGLTLLGVRRFSLPRSSQALKRILDLVTAVVGLILVAPLMAVIAVAIQLDSRGPVLFRQPRVGRRGETFSIFKFRTMCHDAEALKADLAARNEGADGFFKIRDDPRITRVGRVLRRTSLDELPQLFNVLRGEMSVVGPRPLIDEEDCRVPGWYRRRLELAPGITGPWQVLGSSRVPLREMVALDYLYAANWSLWGDVKIVLRTIGFVLARRGL